MTVVQTEIFGENFWGAMGGETSLRSKLAKFLEDEEEFLVIFMVVICAGTFVTSLLIVWSVRWCQKLTPTLLLSISLALSHALGSGVNCLRWFIFSLLPIYYTDMEEDVCFYLGLEALR